MEFNNKGFDDFRRDFKIAMKALENKHGVSIGMGSIRYGEREFTSKMTVLKTDKIQEGKSHDQILFEENAESFGVRKGDWNGRVKLHDGTPARLIGLKPRSYKYPFIAETNNGTKYKMSSTQVQNTIIR